MNRFKIRKTKMLDEAVLGHKKQGIFLTTVIFVLVYIIGSTLSSVIQSIPLSIYSITSLMSSTEYNALMEQFMADQISYTDFMLGMVDVVESLVVNLPFWISLISLFSTALIIVASVVYCVKFEKRPISSMGIRKKDFALEYGLGFLIGAVMYGLSFLITFLTGTIEISFNEFSPVIFLFLLAFVVQGASEEFLVRGYYMVSLARDNKIAVAIALSSIFFGIMHIGNAGVSFVAIINIILMGIFLGIYVFKRGDLWGACAIHTSWNFVQGNIFGSLVSGMRMDKPLFITNTVGDATFVHGGAFGLEGSLCVTLVLLLAILAVLLIGTKKSEISDFDIVE